MAVIVGDQTCNLQVADRDQIVQTVDASGSLMLAVTIR